MLLTKDAEDVTIMNKSYTFRPTKLSEQLSPKTETHILIENLRAFSHLNFTWKEQLLIRLCFCCKRKDRHSTMFEKGKEKLYAEMDLIRLIK